MGIQLFEADFRGFLFSDNEPGVRLFGNMNNNRIQYNLAWFHSLEKDTNSGLNSYTLPQSGCFHRQRLFPGFAEIFPQSQHQSEPAGIHDGIHVRREPRSGDDSVQLDKNGFVARPAPIGTIHPNDVHAFYLGWGGDGHIGAINVSHPFYQVLH